MPSSLQSTIQSLSETLASHIVDAIRSMSLDEIASLGNGASRRGPGRPRNVHTTSRRGPGRPPKAHAAANGYATAKKSKRLHKRSAAEIGKIVEKIVGVVKSHKKGINAEGIKAALKIQRKELPKPLGMALKSKKITKRGKKRATMYFGA